jgi:hypothetical protein
MKPSSTAWRIEYRWKASYVSFAPPTPGTRWPNRFSVLGLGVAVNAKYVRFSCARRAAAE